MKKHLLLLAALYFSLSIGEGWGETAYAQTNLVPNPSFEDTVSCPSYDPSILHVKNWFGVFDTLGPLYYNQCSIATYFGVPNNQYGSQNAQNGVAYASIVTSSDSTIWQFSLNSRYYLETQLIDTLKTGTNYQVSFYVSCMDSSHCTSPDIGVYFSDKKIQQSSDSVLSVFPQIKNKINNSLASDTSWVLVTDSFTAKGNEAWIIIGNFKDYRHTSFSLNSGGKNWFAGAGYYIDNVSVIENKKAGIQEIPKINAIIFPNPTSNLINIILSENINVPNKTTIYNENGVEVWGKNNTTDRQFKIDLTNLPAGIYIFQLQNQNNLITKKITKL